MKNTAFTALCALLLPAIPAAETLLETERSWDGNAFHYPDGEPRVTSIILTVGQDETTAWHCHPVPTLGYVLSGTLEVETADGDRVTLRQGDSVVEVMATLHRGHGLAGGAKIVVFYAGARGIPNTVLATDAASASHCRGHIPAP